MKQLKLLLAASMLFLLTSRANSLIVVIEPGEGLTLSRLSWANGSFDPALQPVSDAAQAAAEQERTEGI